MKMALTKSKYEGSFLKYLPYWVVGSGLVTLVSFFNNNFRPIPFVLLLCVVGIFFMIVFMAMTLVLGIIRREYFIYKWMILPVFCFLCLRSIGPMISLATKVRDIEFKHRINDYNSVANDIRDGKILMLHTPPLHDPCQDLVDVDMTNIPRLPSTVINIWACRCDGDKMVIFFRTSRDRGLVFIDPNGKEPCEGAKKFLKDISLDPIAENWYKYKQY